ncbi:DNA recombination protein RmuC [bacterium]|nr:DNA recombination protein RmuC [bacterium]
MNWIFLTLGLALGLLIGWFIALYRTRASADRALMDLDGRARASQAQADELRKQIESLRAEAAQLQDALRKADSERAAAARVEDAERAILEQKGMLDEARTKLSDAFKSLAADALSRNNQNFIDLARQVFGSLQKEASTDLEHRKAAIEDLVRPLKETLDLYQRESQVMEEKRLREYSAVGEQLRSLAGAQATLQGETAKLVNALRAPQVRGRWGEITLRRCAELAGMANHCDFFEQQSVESENGRLRPDMIVKLPAGREVVVDSKVPLEAYLLALEARTDDEREKAQQSHVEQIKRHVSQLSNKEYWDQFESAPEFVVLFIPNDSFLAAAAERDPALVEHALAKRVVIATPSTFIALLRAVAYGWRQEQVAENAKEISRLGEELHDRMAVLAEHLQHIGDSLGRSVEAYNKAVSSVETRVLPSARRFKTLGAGSKKDIVELEPVEITPRHLEPG